MLLNLSPERLWSKYLEKFNADGDRIDGEFECFVKEGFVGAVLMVHQELHAWLEESMKETERDLKQGR